MNYKEQRKVIKHKLGRTLDVVRHVFTKKPEYRSLKMADDLIRVIWAIDETYSASSILRAARKLRAEGFDDEGNQDVRANYEVAFREQFKND